jgi:macrolide-specific efflux system membrane fusion protein
MKLKVALILVLVVAGAGAVFVSMGGLTARAATTTYLTATAATADVSDDVAATGAVESTANYGLAFGSPAHLVDASASSSSASGGSTATWTVKTVDVGLGAAVKKGQKLATATTTDLATDLTAAVSSRRSAAIQLEIAQDNLDNASGTDAIRQAKLGLYQAQSQLAQAETQQHDIEAQLAAATLVAPIDGIVSAINITAGADAPSGDAIVVDAGTYDVTADVVETDISKINLNQPATVTIGAISSDVAGTVAAISPASSTSSGSGSSGSVVSYAVTVTLTDPPAALKSGMTADITITTASATNVLTVPAAALNGSSGNYTVRVLGPDGTPQVRPVEVGLVTSSLAEITSGLNQGEAVITGTASQRNQTVTNSFGPGGGTFVGTGGGGGRFQGGGPGN